ncbi:glycoside hydrolase family 5 protein [Maribacter halichondriae]|uniref:glycoside hydrolase family 5 protein n=1 Tax=Maribacter halichondriae TaxID=2980554 RepID=UPI0023594A2D|nr:cellulase family glycosylhydrolase [Maribacter sp. Hal144]
MKKYLFLLFSFVMILSCGSDDNQVPPNTPNPESQEPKTPVPAIEENSENLLLQLDGAQLVDANKNPMYLQGVAFGNFVWQNTTSPPEHHTEEDYKRVSDMGMNAIRFYMNYSYFEDETNAYAYKQSGWDWLDQNIAWAEKYGIYLILNMHVPQGGYQSQGEGDALWDNVENQNRLAALWKEIARRYVNQVQIAGFGLLNEPVPNTSINQWSQLAQRLINDIRSANKNHLIFVEKAIYVKGREPDENLDFPSVTGTNLVYEFHGYDPYFYTHQLLDFARLGDGGRYPDENVIETGNTEWYTATFDNPSLASGTTDWTFFEGIPFIVNDPEIKLALPALVADNVGGKVYFDDITVKEYDENGNFVRDVYEANLDALASWLFWSRNESGANGLSISEGHNDSSSLFIENTTDDSNMSNYGQLFEVRQGYSYQISGWMKGENVANGTGTKIRLDFLTTDFPVFKRNKDYMASVTQQIVDWAQTKNTVLYMGEFGVGNPCFENDKGGLQWVTDMVDILKENDIHFTYHTYHEDAFGLYLGNGQPDPNNVNQPLIDLFTELLN